MAISAQELAKGLLETLQAQPKHQTKIAHEFVSMMEEQGLVSLLPQVVSYLEYYAGVREREKELHITVAHKPDKQALEGIIKSIKGEQVPDPVVHVDESLVGGFVAEHENIVYDGSVKNQLNQVTQWLTK